MKEHPDYPGWARDSVAGKDWREGDTWERKGAYQLAFMKRQGLLPNHRMIDVGCGVLRGGVQFIRYLDEKKYFGFDKEEEFIRIAKQEEVPAAGLFDKKPRLLAAENFNFGQFGVTFDMGFCMSVFTHVVPDLIALCLRNVRKTFVPGGRFYATFNTSPEGQIDLSTLLETHKGMVHISWRKNERLRTKYPPSLLVDLAQKEGLEANHIGPWDEPHSRQGVHSMMEFVVP